MAQVAIVTTGHPQDIASSKDTGKGAVHAGCCSAPLVVDHTPEQKQAALRRQPNGSDRRSREHEHAQRDELGGAVPPAQQRVAQLDQGRSQAHPRVEAVEDGIEGPRGGIRVEKTVGLRADEGGGHDREDDRHHLRDRQIVPAHRQRDTQLEEPQRQRLGRHLAGTCEGRCHRVRHRLRWRPRRVRDLIVRLEDGLEAEQREHNVFNGTVLSDSTIEPVLVKCLVLKLDIKTLLLRTNEHVHNCLWTCLIFVPEKHVAVHSH